MWKIVSLESNGIEKAFVFQFRCFSSDTIFHMLAPLHRLALDVSSRHAYAGNLTVQICLKSEKSSYPLFCPVLGEVLPALQVVGNTQTADVMNFNNSL